MATKKKKTEVINTTDNILLEYKGNDDLKKELEEYVDEKINKVFIDELDKANRKLLREKSRKIVFKNIFIVILLAIIGFLVYILYTNNYFDQFFNKNNNKNNNDIVEKEKKEEDKKEDKPKKEPTLNELKKEYANLLDSYVLSDEANYLSDFYNGNLTSNLKKYFTLNSLDFSSLTKEDGYNIISDETFKIAYEKLFDDTYENGNFDYNDNNIRYVNMMNSYITSTLLEKSSTNIKREIINIKVDGKKVLITTIEGIVSENKLFNALTGIELEDYQDGSIIKYSDSLNKITYVFNDSKLINLEK